MLDFFDKLENKRAFKRALKEIEAEDSNRAQTATRVYKSNEGASISRPCASAAAKPLSNAVDLKYFEDWNKVDKVESKNPSYRESSFRVREPEKKSEPKSYSHESLTDILSKDKVVEEKSNRESYSSFLSAKSENKEGKSSSSISELFAEMQRRRAAVMQSDAPKVSEPEVKEEKPQQQIQPQENPKSEIKVEVIDKVPETEVAKKAVTKPKTNRRPRGKSKRRFDADVISSVDWR